MRGGSFIRLFFFSGSGWLYVFVLYGCFILGLPVNYLYRLGLGIGFTLRDGL